jgi:5-methylcytosine-specific restriction endonuclease McrA
METRWGSSFAGSAGSASRPKQFYAAKGTRTGRRTECIVCNLEQKAARNRADPVPARQRTQRWRRENPERDKQRWARFVASGGKKRSDRKGHLRRKFGLTIEQYEALLQRQGGRCAICRSPGNGSVSLHVDHDHVTGRVRGLLCFRCNGGLGQFREEPELLRRAARYVENGPDPTSGRPR